MATTGTSAAPAPAAPAALRAEPSPTRRILCTIDFSEASVAAVSEAVALARAWHGEITVLFVVPCSVPTRANRSQVPDGVSAAVTEDVEALLAPARAAGIAVRVCLRAGWPAQEILEVARRIAPDVIVMGTHGRGGLKRRVLGSVTAEILRNAMCPVLTIGHRRTGPELPVPAATNTVVCAVGLSASSPGTLAHALDAARTAGSRLVLMHVLGDHATDMRAARARLHALATAQERPGDRIEELVVAGAPARQILRMAAARRAALVVVGAEGPSSPPGGSATDQVIRRAPCAVLTVPSPLPPS